MIVNSFKEMEELAKETVMFAMNNEPNRDFLEKQNVYSIFYKVYDDICNKNLILGSAFAIHLKEKYGIEIPIR
jgi:hypothetical protein